jgi:2-methylisocitrate lyase-like PEP mutase family enzyme
MMKKTSIFRKLIERKEILVAPGVYDGISARLVQVMGFQAGSITGSGVSESRLGKPDVGIMGLANNLDQTRNIVNSVDIPVRADADTGYGNAVNTYFTVQMFEEAGVAGIVIEDQVWPKRCGHLAGKEVISAEEMIKKVEAAVAARKDPDFVLGVRTDAGGVIGIEEAIRRANCYAEAGADVLLADALLNREDIRRFVQGVKKPVSVNMGFGIRSRPTTPLISPSELESMGVAMVSYPRLITSAAIQGMKNALEVLKQSVKEGRVIERPDLVIGFDELSDLMGLPDILELERKFLTVDAWKGKYERK